MLWAQLVCGVPADWKDVFQRIGVESILGMTRIVTLTVNGEERQALAEDRMLLADFIRQQLQLTGTHLGCEQGVCGACTIEYNGELVRSCLMFAVQADGSAIRTVEGIADSATALHPIQLAFQRNHALQCAFCTSGFLMSAKALLDEKPNPSEEQVREALSGNICRCTGYAGIVRAVLDAAAVMGS